MLPYATIVKKRATDATKAVLQRRMRTIADHSPASGHASSFDSSVKARLRANGARPVPAGPVSGLAGPWQGLREAGYLLERVVVHERRADRASFHGQAETAHQLRRIHV